ncbi:unnamed protein product [Ixodes pacificus]
MRGFMIYNLFFLLWIPIVPFSARSVYWVSHSNRLRESCIYGASTDGTRAHTYLARQGAASHRPVSACVNSFSTLACNILRYHCFCHDGTAKGRLSLQVPHSHAWTAASSS